jgi:phage terminase large subunit
MTTARLQDHHLADLKGSGLSDETITAARCYSGQEPTIRELLIQQEYFLNVDIGLVGAYYAKQLDFARQEGRVTSVPYTPACPWRRGGTSAWPTRPPSSTQSVGDRVHILDCLETSGEGLGYYVHELRNRGYTYDRYTSHHARMTSA